MNLALVWAGKEWRSQRGLLGAYLGLVFAALMLGFLLAPGSWWVLDGNRAWTLGWFVAAGSIGVLAFAAPQLVRGELGSKDDQFVRRLPGALGPAFAGKMLFLLLASAALPLLGLAVGELFFAATGRQWDDLFRVSNITNEPAIAWPLTFVAGAAALLLGPWVAVFAWWMPGARLALGATGVCASGLALGAFTVLRSCPGLERTMHGERWLWFVVPLGIVVGWASCVRGRRGGDFRRSAKLGAAVMAVGLAPPAVWLLGSAWEYHHPDLQRAVRLGVEGLSPDLRFAVVYATSHGEWSPVQARIDLATGEATQLAGIDAWTSQDGIGSFSGLVARRYSTMIDGSGARWLDLTTGAMRAVDAGSSGIEVPVPMDLRDAIAGQVRAASPLRGPAGCRAWVSGAKLYVESSTGTVQPFDWSRSRFARPVGHGIEGTGGREHLWFDLARLQFVQMPERTDDAFAVQGIWLVRAGNRSRPDYRRLDPSTSVLDPCPELQGCTVLALLDDDRAVCVRQRPGKGSGELFLYRPADRSVTSLASLEQLAGERVTCGVDGLHGWLPFGLRDPQGRLWLPWWSNVRRPGRHGFLTIDPVTLQCETRLVHEPDHDGSRAQTLILAFADGHTLLAQEDSRRIVEIDYETGARTVLFPRESSR